MDITARRRAAHRALAGFLTACVASLGCTDRLTSAEGGETGEAGEAGETGETGESPPAVERIGASLSAVCSYHSDGSTTCWGRLGFNTLVGRDDPASSGRLEAPLDFEQVEQLGATCGLSAGVVYCWGHDYGSGLLGYGLGDELVSLETAIERGGVEIGEPVVALVSATGTDVVRPVFCALTEGGSVFCWGTGEGLGYPLVDTVGAEESPADMGPVQIGGIAVAVYAGDLGTCALLDDGALRCWGSSTVHGHDVGFGLHPAEIPPVQLGAPIQSVSIGDGHACAIIGDGEVVCWGVSSRGALGHPGGANVAPGPNLEPVELGGAAVEIVARIGSTCARLDDGSVVCWGSGEFGKTGHPWPSVCVGVAGAFDCTADPRCCIGDDETPASVGLVEMPGPIRDLAGTGLGFCGLGDDGVVSCWGSGAFGVLGDGLTPDCTGFVDDTATYIDCSLDPRCCIGDDETPAAAGRPVIFE